MKGLFNYFADSFEELKSNVSWPEWADVQRYTVVVAVFSIAFALATWGVDELFANSLSGFFSYIRTL